MGKYSVPENNFGIKDISDAIGNTSVASSVFDLNDTVAPHAIHEMYGGLKGVQCPDNPYKPLKYSDFAGKARFTGDTFNWEDPLWLKADPGRSSYFPGPGADYWNRLGTGPVVGMLAPTGTAGSIRYCGGYGSIQRIDALTKTAGVDIPNNGRVAATINKVYLDHEYYFMVTTDQHLGTPMNSCNDRTSTNTFTLGKPYMYSNANSNHRWHWLSYIAHHGGGTATITNGGTKYYYDYNLATGDKLYFAHCAHNFGYEAANMNIDISIEPRVPHPITACFNPQTAARGGNRIGGEPIPDTEVIIPDSTNGRKIAEGNFGGTQSGSINVPSPHNATPGTYLLKILVNGGASCEVTQYRAYYDESGKAPIQRRQTYFGQAPSNITGWRNFHIESGCRGSSDEPCAMKTLVGNTQSAGGFHDQAIPHGSPSYIALQARYGWITGFNVNWVRSRGYGGKLNNPAHYYNWELWKADMDLTEGTLLDWTLGITEIADTFHNKPILYSVIGDFCAS